MKRITLVSLLTAMLGWSAFGQSTLDLTAAGYFTDLTGVYANALTGTGNQTSRFSPTLEALANYGYSIKLDDAQNLRAGLLVDFFYGLENGLANTAYEPGQNATKIDPSIQWTGWGLSLKTNFPILVLNPATAGGVNTAAYGFVSPITYGALKDAIQFPVKDNSVLVNEAFQATYKLSFDKTTFLTLGASANFNLTPLVWLTEAKPLVTFVSGPVQLDTNFGLYNLYNSNVAKQGQDYSWEPKVTYDLASVGVAGLKAYFQGKVNLASTQSKYTAAAPYHGYWLRPGLTYKIDAFTIEANWTILNLGLDSGNANDFYSAGKFKDIYSDPALKLTYSLKF